MLKLKESVGELGEGRGVSDDHPVLCSSPLPGELAMGGGHLAEFSPLSFLSYLFLIPLAGVVLVLSTDI